MISHWERVAVCCQLAGKNTVSVSLNGGALSAMGSDGCTVLAVGPGPWVDHFGLSAEGLAAAAKMEPDKIEDLGGKVRFHSPHCVAILSKLPAVSQQISPPTGNPMMGLSRESLLGPVSRIRHAVAAKGHPRPIMEGIHLTPWRGQMYAVATDSRRMAAAPIGQAIADWVTTLPVGVFDLLGRIWGEERGQIFRDRNGWYIEGENGEWRMRAAPFEGRFPNPLRVFDELEGIPDGVEWEVELGQIREHLERAKLFSKTDDRNFVTVTMGPESWAIESENDMGSYRGDGPTRTTNPGIYQIVISPIFLGDLVRRIQAETLEVRFLNRSKPVLFRSGSLMGIISQIEPPTAPQTVSTPEGAPKADSKADLKEIQPELPLKVAQ